MILDLELVKNPLGNDAFPANRAIFSGKSEYLVNDNSAGVVRNGYRAPWGYIISRMMSVSPTIPDSAMGEMMRGKETGIFAPDTSAGARAALPVEQNSLSAKYRELAGSPIAKEHDVVKRATVPGGRRKECGRTADG